MIGEWLLPFPDFLFGSAPGAVRNFQCGARFDITHKPIKPSPRGEGVAALAVTDEVVAER